MFAYFVEKDSYVFDVSTAPFAFARIEISTCLDGVRTILRRSVAEDFQENSFLTLICCNTAFNL